jgi:hypothetical protein
MPIPFKLEYVIEKTQVETTSEQLLIKKMTGVKISADEARAVWPRVLDHKWYISERLGRDVGLRVAAVDYFENIWTPRPPRAPKFNAVRNWLRHNPQPHILGA